VIIIEFEQISSYIDFQNAVFVEMSALTIDLLLKENGHQTRMFHNSVNFHLNHLKLWIWKHQFIKKIS
jgi:hypothetical protein